MVDFIYDNQIIKVDIITGEAFVTKFNRLQASGNATDLTCTHFENESLKLYQFTQNGERYYVYEELLEAENGVTSHLYFSKSKVNNFEDMILKSKKCLQIFETT